MMKRVFILSASVTVLACSQQPISAVPTEPPIRQSFRICDKDPPQILSQLTLTELKSAESKGAMLQLCMVVAVGSGRPATIGTLKGEGPLCDSVTERNIFRTVPVFGVGNELAGARDRQSSFEPRLNRRNFQFFSFIVPPGSENSCELSPVLRPGVPYVIIEKDSELVSVIPYVPGVTIEYLSHFDLDVSIDESEVSLAYAIAIEAEMK